MPHRPSPGLAVGYSEACDFILHLLRGPARVRAVEWALTGRSPREAMAALRSAMDEHRFPTGAGPLAEPVFASMVREFDRRTGREGFRALHDWDGRAGKFKSRLIPSELLEHFRRLGPNWRPEQRHLLMLLDYYLLYILTLLLMRAWDEGDPEENLVRVDAMLEALQGPGGSGLRLLEGVETLIWIAISNYHPDEDAYPRLLDKLRVLHGSTRRRFARVGAAVLGSHLRWGLVAYYRGDLDRLRRDNLCDYPWLLFAVHNLSAEYAEMVDGGADGPEREAVVGALANGLSADVPVMTGRVTGPLDSFRDEHRSFLEIHHALREPFLDELEIHRPGQRGYFPNALHFNFPHNLLKGRVALALAGDAAPNLPVDALLRVPPRTRSAQTPRRRMADLLTEFAWIHPERTGSGEAAAVAYDTGIGGERFAEVEAAASDLGSDRTQW